MTTTANRPRIGIGTADITEEDRARVMHALVTGRLSAGPFMAEFESRFAAMHERKHAAMYAPGTFPYAERALANGFYIGSRQGMNDDGIATIAGIVRPILEEASP